MKRRASIRLDIELDASTPTGIDEAAQEALAQLKCDAFMDCGDGQYWSAKLVEKQYLCQDEHLLLDLVLKATGVSHARFVKGRHWKEAQARHIYAFFAKKYFERSDGQIANFLHRDRSTVTQGLQSIISLVAKEPYSKRSVQTYKGTYLVARNLRASRAAEVMTSVQLSWNRIKE
jgi:hypothetical protein